MKVVGIYGSPRKGGNSDGLLDRALDGAKKIGAQITSIRAAELEVAGCRNCGGCDKTGECVVQDGMQKIYPLLDEADRIIVSAPIFFYSYPAQLKALIDRAQSRWARRALGQTSVPRMSSGARKGYLIAVGATRGKKLFEGVELTAKYFFHALDMTYEGGLFFRSVDKKGAIKKLPGAFDQAYQLGVRAASED